MGEKPNNESWIETHFEVVSFITVEMLKDEPQGAIGRAHQASGHGGLYELAQEWTNLFEWEHRGRVWEGDFFDTIDKWLKIKNNAKA